MEGTSSNDLFQPSAQGRQLSQVAQVHVQVGFENLKGETLQLPSKTRQNLQHQASKQHINFLLYQNGFLITHKMCQIASKKNT